MLAFSERAAFRFELPLPPNSTTLDRLEVQYRLLLSRNDPRFDHGEYPLRTRGEIHFDFNIGRGGWKRRDRHHDLGDDCRSGTKELGHVPRARLRHERALDGSSARIRELEIQLRLATTANERANQLSQQHAISLAGLDEARGKVTLTIATLQGMADDFTDDLERARLVVKQERS